MEKYFLAIDASTSKIGLSVWDLNDYSLKECFGWQNNSKLNLLQKASFFEEQIKTIIEKYNIIESCIEAPKLSMMNMHTGNQQITSAKTLKVLSQINFAIQYILFKKNIHIEELDEKFCKRFSYPGYKVKRNGVTIKMQYHEQIIKDETINSDLYNFSYKDKKGEENLYKWVEDIMDSIIVGKAYLNIKKEGLKIQDLI